MKAWKELINAKYTDDEETFLEDFIKEAIESIWEAARRGESWDLAPVIGIGMRTVDQLAAKLGLEVPKETLPLDNHEENEE